MMSPGERSAGQTCSSACCRLSVACKAAGRGMPGRYAALTCSLDMARTSSGLRTQSRVSACVQANAASAVPQLPAPRTATRTREGRAPKGLHLKCDPGGRDHTGGFFTYTLLLVRPLLP